MTLSETKSPSWMRLAQIGLGIIAIVLSIYVLTSSPVLTLVTIALLIAVVLFVVGIERIIKLPNFIVATDCRNTNDHSRSYRKTSCSADLKRLTFLILLVVWTVIKMI